MDGQLAIYSLTLDQAASMTLVQASYLLISPLEYFDVLVQQVVNNVLSQSRLRQSQQVVDSTVSGVVAQRALQQIGAV